MLWRFGTGPVFTFELLTISRRWQVYATRGGFVGLLLLGLGSVALKELSQPVVYAPQLASVGQSFFTILTIIQLGLIMLAAPASTAGSICLDRARGTLAHVLMTDLSSSEIILGKFASRLLPTLALILCSLPVALIATLLGGIDPEALVGLFLLSLAVAFLGCSLAIMLSVWASKTHEVLLVIFGLWACWILSSPILEDGGNVLGWANFFVIFESANPFYLAMAPYNSPLTFRLWHDLVFLAVCSGLSLGFLGIATLKVRHVSAKTNKQARPYQPHRLWKWLPGPSLDTNPVFWREWNRARPSRWTRWVSWTLGSIYVLLIVVDTCKTLNEFWMGSTSTSRYPNSEFGPLVHGFAIAVGLMIVAVNASTSLAEERVRGSLDVLMTTPLSTRTIVMAKWWGVFLRGTILLLPPTFAVTLDVLVYQGGPLTILLMPCLILSYLAGVASLGLFVATLTPRLGRAVGWVVAIYAMVAVGGYLFPMMVLQPDTNDLDFGLACISPFVGVAITVIGAENSEQWESWGGRGWITIWIVVYTTIHFALLVLTLTSFDRKLGRVSEKRFSLRMTKRQPIFAINLRSGG